MRTFGEFITEAEGFQGKMTPGHNAAKGAITLNNKLEQKKKKPDPPGKLALRPTTRAVQSPGALAVRPNRDTTTKKETIGVPKGQQKSTPSSKPSTPASGKPFRRVVRDAEANRERDNSPKRGSELAKTGAGRPDGGPGRALRDKLAKQDNIAKRKAFRDAKRGATNAFKDAVRMTSKSGPGVAQSTDLKGPPRGIYNPK